MASSKLGAGFADLWRCYALAGAGFELCEVAAHVQAVHQPVMGFNGGGHHEPAVGIGREFAESDTGDAANAVGFVARVPQARKLKPGDDGVEQQIKLEIAVGACARGNRARRAAAFGVARGKAGEVFSRLKGVVHEPQVSLRIEIRAAAVQEIVQAHFITGKPQPELGDGVGRLHRMIEQGRAKRDAGSPAAVVKPGDLNLTGKVEFRLCVVAVQLKNRAAFPAVCLDDGVHACSAVQG